MKAGRHIERRVRAAVQDQDGATLVQLMTDNHPRTMLQAIAAYAQAVPGLEDIAARVNGCSTHKRCFSRFCPRCAFPSPDRRSEVSNQERLATSNSRSKNPRIRARQIAQAFDRFPETEVWFVTINFAAVMPSDLAEAIKVWRTRMRRYLRRVAPEAVVNGRFEFDPRLAKQIGSDHLSDQLSVLAVRAEDAILKLHLHALVHVPGWQREWLTESLAREFGDGHVVRVRPIRHAVGPNEIDLLGTGGVAAYMAKEFTTLNELRGRPLEHITEVIRALHDVDRRQTGFGFGMRKLANPDARAEGRWLRRCRKEYGLPRDMGKVDIEAYLLEHDIDQLLDWRIDEDAIRADMHQDFLRGSVVEQEEWVDDGILEAIDSNCSGGVEYCDDHYCGNSAHENLRCSKTLDACSVVHVAATSRRLSCQRMPVLDDVWQPP